MKFFLVLIFGKTLFAQELKDFKLKIYNQESIFSLKDELNKNKFVFINFFASWCKPCNREIPKLEELKKNSSKNILFIAVNQGEDNSKIKSFLNKTKFSYLILEDPNQTISDLWNINSIPRTFVIGKGLKKLFQSSSPPENLDDFK